MAGTVLKHQANQLLHNKFVVILGDSIQRSVYKDLVLILQKDAYLSSSQLRSKGEFSFEKDTLVEGGRLASMNNGTAYREVRQYRSDHHLVRFYFVTRIFSHYMESILADFERGIKPDLVIVNSCVWDVSRYGRNWDSEYRANLNKFFRQLKAVLPEESLIVWNMAMPLGKRIVGGFLVPEIQDKGPSLRFDVIEANFYGATLADDFGFDVLDMHFQFRFSLHLRTNDGIHWNAVAHRKITCLLLEHAAQAWGVELSSPGELKTDHAVPQSHIQQTSSSSLVGNKQVLFSTGSRSDQRCFKVPMQPVNHYNNGGIVYRHPPGPAFRQGQLMGQYNGFAPIFYRDDLPPPFTPGHPNLSAAPYWPVNNFVMKQRNRRPYNPYPRQKPRHL
nr:PC-esterase domain-containing protein 1A isoform X1 [Misgurnus anguillicaudatus]XP_055056078.1 PC-esterase domain-containing protein 1A isoform X1 [Misgurnus anguillicaudatus]XP_055056086.1 PC-esterase domain-containing protein 1A isoform X1 [Misgurnus anguillicaudatus]